MKKLYTYLLFVFCYLFFVTSPAFANKCGVNIGPNYSQVNQVKNLTKEGGWIVALGSPGNCSNFEGLFGKGLNVVLRAYNGGKKFTEPQALGWIATLGKLDSKGQKIYFMPWNEPNHPEECGGTPCSPEEVKNYVEYLKNQLENAGLLNTKVVLLSPTIDKLNPTFESFRTVYSLGLPSSINAYDQFVSGPCSAASSQNNCLYDQIGIPAPYYAPEAGVAGTCAPWPCYRDSELSQMLDRSWQKWKDDGNFKMFAIFSYDPHRPGSWDIFSASQTTTFYQNNCFSGSVIYGGFDQQKFNAWFSSVQSQLVNCDGCGYAPNKEFCVGTGAGTTEPEVISLQNSLICADFDIKYSHTSETQTQLTPTPTSSVEGITSNLRRVSGTLRLERENLPDFSQANKIFRLALERLLPADSKKNLFIDQTPLKAKITHHVVGKDNEGKEIPAEKNPETEITLPSWWTSLLATTKILCGLFNTCSPPKNLAIKVEQPSLTSPSQNTACPLGNRPKTEPVLGINTLQEEFRTQSLWQKITETINDIINWIQRIITKEETELKNKSRGELVGGETFNQQSSFLNSFLPSELIPPNKNAPLAGEANYKVKIEGKEVASGDNLHYQNLGKARASSCLQRCSLHPSQTNISEIAPSCTSCHPEDYQLKNFEDGFLDKSLCQKNPDGSCDYFQPGDSPRCDGDPICESGKCYPLMWRQANDYISRGCSLPYSATDCNDPSVCRKMTFSKNPAGGYGSCQYSNPNVCVRTDQNAVGSCAALCNWACCAYQK